jgi:preprotein translocase subunit SecD
MTEKSSRNQSGIITPRKIRGKLWALLALLVVCVVVVAPSHYINTVVDSINQKAHIGIPRLPNKGFNLGLDLQGGAHLVYQAQTKQIAVGAGVAGLYGDPATSFHGLVVNGGPASPSSDLRTRVRTFPAPSPGPDGGAGTPFPYPDYRAAVRQQ